MAASVIIFLIYLEYFAIGLPDGLLGVAWPSMRAYFNMPIDALGLLPLASTPGYLLAGIFSGRIMKKFGIPHILAAGCALAGSVFLFFTVSPSWFLIAAAGFFSGFGIGLIDAGLNLYVAKNMSKRQMQWLHACWGVGITLGPFIMTAGLSTLRTWKPGYIMAGALQLFMSVCFVFFARKWGMGESAIEAGNEVNETTLMDTLSQLKVWRRLSLFLLYTGTESVIGLWGYSLLTESRGVAPAVAGIFTGSYWAIFTISRILAGFYTRHVEPKLFVVLCLLSGLSGIVLLWLNISSFISLSGLVITGFSLAPIFPSLMSDTEARLGTEHLGNAVGMQFSAAMLGGALMPGIAGVLARRFTHEAIPVFLIISFLALTGISVTFLNGRPDGRS